MSTKDFSTPFEISAEDLQDPSLGKLNLLFRLLFERIGELYGTTGKTKLQGELVVPRARSLYKGFPESDDELITWGQAKRLFGPDVVAEAYRRRKWLGQAVRPFPKEAVEEEKLPDVGVQDVRVESVDGQYAFAGKFVFNCSADYYENLFVVKIYIHGPLDQNGQETSDTRLQFTTEVQAPEGVGIVEVPWMTDAWDRPRSTEYYRLLFVVVGRGGSSRPNNPAESDLLVVRALSEIYPVPDVPLFLAGRMREDGTFDQSSYWDDQRLWWLKIDWAAWAPAERANWSGISVWVITPDGSAHDATGFIPFSEFGIDADGNRLIRRTIFIEPKHVPESPTYWVVRCVSHDRYGEPKRDVDGTPIGPSVWVAISGYQLAPQVTDFRAYVGRGQVNQHGQQTWYLYGSFTAPDDRLWREVEIRGQWADESEEFVIGRFTTPPGSNNGEFRTDSWPLPAKARWLILRAYSVSATGKINTSNPPQVSVYVSEQVGQRGKEYAEFVTNVSAQRYVDYSDELNFEPPGGIERFGFILSWQDPNDPAYTGVKIYAKDPSGRIQALTGQHKQKDAPLKTDSWPLSNNDIGLWKIFFVSCSGTNENTINEDPNQGPVTPAVSVLVTRTSSSKVRGDRVESIPIASFAQGLRPVVLVSSLPSLPSSDYPPGSYVFHTGEWKLYRVSSNGYNWEPGVNTGDLANSAVTYDKLAANSVTAGAIQAGAVSSYHLNSVEISVGGGGGKPGRFGVYDANGNLIGWIGVYSGYQGGWFKELSIGGSGPSDARIKANQYGEVEINLSSNQHTLVIREGEPYGPFRVYQPGYEYDRDVRIGASNYGTGVYVGYPYVLGSALTKHGLVINGASMLYSSVYWNPDYSYTEVKTEQLSYNRIISMRVGTNASDCRLYLKNVSVIVDDYTCVDSQTIAYQKPDGSTGYITVRRGLIISVT